MTSCRILLLLFALSICALSGCAATLKSSPLPEGCTVRTLAKLDPDAPVAVNRQGTVATVFENAVRLSGISEAPGRIILPEKATRLAFSPNGEELAASFSAGGKSTLKSLDLNGKPLAQAAVNGIVTSLIWRSDQELLATALVVRKFSFGSELVSLLYRWDLKGAPVATELYDVTIRPKLAKLPDAVLAQSLSMALSPYGDEIAYIALKDPPLFTPYLRVAVRHLASGAEREVAETGIGSGGPLYSADGENILVGNEQAMTRLVKVPEGREINAWPVAGDRMALSPGGSYLLLDGHLYFDGQEVASFPKESTGFFLPDGSGLLIKNGEALFLVSGLKEAPRKALSNDLPRLLELRKLRMTGLITDSEFRKSLKNGAVK